MADKSPKKATNDKKPGRTIKEKRAAKKMKQGATKIGG